jgi:hypothetical protein
MSSDTEMLELPVKLPGDLWETLSFAAAHHDETPNARIEVLVRRWVEPTERRDIQRVVSDILKASRNWEELIQTLSDHDLKYKLAGGGLSLHRRSTGKYLFAACEVGPSYHQLVKRLGPAPGQARFADRRGLSAFPQDV